MQMMPNFWLFIYLLNMMILMLFFLMNYFNINIKKL